MNISDYDVCECGDFRKDHEDGWKRCTHCDGASMSNQECMLFRVWKFAKITWSVAGTQTRL